MSLDALTYCQTRGSFNFCCQILFLTWPFFCVHRFLLSAVWKDTVVTFCFYWGGRKKEWSEFSLITWILQITISFSTEQKDAFVHFLDLTSNRNSSVPPQITFKCSCNWKDRLFHSDTRKPSQQYLTYSQFSLWPLCAMFQLVNLNLFRHPEIG